MAKVSVLTKWLFITTLLTASGVACESDDDGGSNTGGSSSMGGDSAQSGSTNTGGNDSSTHGGDGNGGDDGASHGGSGGAGGDLGGGGTAGGAGGEGGGPPTATLSDAQILLVLDTLNQGEVEEAYAALPRLSVADVEEFAQQMIAHHGTARQSVVSTADNLELNPAPSEVQSALKQEAEMKVAQLRAADATVLDRTYIDMQVVAHAEALSLLSDLEAAADAAELDTLIGTLQTTVQEHYDTALAIQAEL